MEEEIEDTKIAFQFGEICRLFKYENEKEKAIEKLENYFEEDFDKIKRITEEEVIEKADNLEFNQFKKYPGIEKELIGLIEESEKYTLWIIHGFPSYREDYQRCEKGESILTEGEIRRLTEFFDNFDRYTKKIKKYCKDKLRIIPLMNKEEFSGYK